ncbi:carbohydrate binding domain-containing protein [Frondihabitans australicus]|uniref:Carbohydrate binding protein n=1 Tax=Frondihabitans australicus TaxID=386892 RepID=A0A495IB71_9MICO|nr:carbohydrate binding domain-containing protein [Frondihabitans australicus]RKR73244.1 carbohydrate binding protein [Frondihabitans australicus]
MSGVAPGGRRILRRLTALVLPFALAATAVTATVAIVSQEPAAATTSASDFQPGNIISDSTFYNTATMTAAQVQAFLNQKVPTCTSGYTCLRNYAQKTATRAADSYCSAYTGAASETAATIIAKVGAACGINPEVILVTLQKEEGLVLSSRPTTGLYTTAMGYGCPDTAACDSTYYGFFNQVYSAAHQFQVYAKNPTYFRYRAGYTNVIQYSPSSACGSASVYVQNQATASLYNYTPYTPNKAALAAGYGSAPCGAYGNRNFFLYFSDWFGNPANYLKSPSFEGRTASGWVWSGGTMNRAIATTSQAQDGSSFLAVNTAGSGRAVSQTVSRASVLGEQANATVWVRSSDARPYTGAVSLTATGGSTETASTPFTVTNTWTQVAVALPFRVSGHSAVRLDVGLGTTGATLWIDDASLTFGAAPVLANTLANPGFEGSFSGWVPGNGAMNRQVYKSPSQAQSGSWFAATNTPVAGRSFAQIVPVTQDASTGYDFTVWLRSADTRAFNGRVALWGLGGSARTVTVQPFTVAKAWTKITVSLDPGATAPTSLKAEVYLDTVASKGTLWLDTASLQRNVLSNASFDAGTAGWSANSSAQSFTTGTAQTLGTAPEDGTQAASLTTTTAGTSVSQTVTASPQVGDTYTATAWVRSGTGATVTGRLAAWGLGGSAEVGVQRFTVGATWTKVTFALPIKNAGHTSLRLEIYDDTVSQPLLVDATRLS